MPAQADVFQDSLLTNISVKFTNTEYIAEQVFPTVKVQKKTGFYFVYDKDNLRVDDDERASGTRANRINWNLTKTAYGPLVEHSLEGDIPYEVRDAAESPLDIRTDTTLAITEKIWLRKEKKLATDLADTGILTQNTTLSGTSQWDDYANSDPFDDVQTAKNEIKLNGLMPANTLILSFEVFAKLIHHPDLLERIKYSQKAVLTTELLASVFQVERVIVGSAVENTGNEGQTAVMAYVWGKHAVLAFITPAPGIRKLSFGYHLQLTNGRVVDRWDEPAVKSEFVRVTDYFQPKVIAKEAAYLIKDAIS